MSILEAVTSMLKIVIFFVICSAECWLKRFKSSTPSAEIFIYIQFCHA